MNKYNSYYTACKFNLLKQENIEEKKVIHDFENRNLEMDLDALNNKYILNEIR